MLEVLRTIRRWLPLVTGTGFGLAVALWTSVQASALLPGLFLTSVTDGQVVSGIVPLSARSDAAGFSSLQFQVSGQNVGPAITAGACTTPWDTRSLSNGVHTVTAVARDSAGNAVWALPAVVTVSNLSGGDTVAPVIGLTSPSAGAVVTGTVTVTAVATDNVGVTGIWFTLDGATLGSETSGGQAALPWATTGTSNGSHVLRALARDAAGNVTTSAAVTVTVNNVSLDSTAPTVSLSAPASGATVSGTVTVSATASDNVGVSSVQFTLDGTNLGPADTSSPFAISWTTTGASNGSHVLRAVARDAAGNVTTSASRTVTVSNVADTTSPSVSLSAPASGATVSGTVTMSATASDNVGVASVQFTLDGTNLGPADTTSPFSISWNTGATANGPHTLRAVARDAAGNTTTSTARTVTVSNSVTDTTQPTVSIAAPSAGSTVTGTTTITASASDNVGVAGVQFKLDGVDFGTEDTSAPYQVVWNTTTFVNGTHSLTAVARDGAGNTRTANAVTVTVTNAGSGVAGDFNGDLTPDLLFQRANGQLYVWLMDGAELERETTLTPGAVEPAWRVVSLDDFNGDRKTDIVWQNNDTGQVYVWFMDGTTLIGETFLKSAYSDWQVATTADLNGDGKIDIVWQHPDSGQMYAWMMNGTTVVSQGWMTPTAVDPSWRVAGSYDINRDGKSDLVWQNSATGALYVWYMNGLVMSQGTALSPAAVIPSWRLRAVGDFNRDSRMDLVWQHATSGQLYIWYMNGIALMGDRYLEPRQVEPAWQIVGGK